MKILFKNRTRYTKKIYDIFLQFHNQKYGSSYIFYTAFIALLIFFCFGMNLKYHNYLIAILLFIAMLIFLYWRFNHPKEKVKKQLNTDTILCEKEFQFRFFDKTIEIVDKTNIFRLKYFNIKHVYETDDYFYLYIDKNYAFILDKNGFVIGQANDFKNFIKCKCHFRFKSYCE